MADSYLPVPAGTASTPDDPSQLSGEMRAMQDDIGRIGDVLDGLKAVRAKSTVYLPQFQMEPNEKYRRRLGSAPWRPEFEDALRTLSSKPFGKPVRILGDDVDERIVGQMDDETNSRKGGLVDDIDGRGNNLTRFAAETFSSAIGFGFDLILVDYPSMNPDETTTRPRTVAEEKAAGLRPYWLHITARDVIAVYTQMIGGKETVVHLRFWEVTTKRDGFGEKQVKRVRVIEPGTWQLYEEQIDKSGMKTWVVVSQGQISRGAKGATSIPVVILYTGRRCGETGVKPPLAQLAHMQIELYQALSRKEEILTFAGNPMLQAKGMAQPDPDKQVTVGAGVVLYTGVSEDTRAEWAYLTVDAAGITVIAKSVEDIQADMRRIGMQPLLQPAGTPTATGQVIDSNKAHSAVKAWALALNDAIEQAWVFTAEWMDIAATIRTEVSTDFSVQPYAQFPLAALLAARAAKDLSQETYWSGLQRFDVLAPDFDPEAEEQRLAEEQQGADALDGVTDIDPITGEPLESSGGTQQQPGGGVSEDDVKALFAPELTAG
jgi:hypothetical protein